MINRDVIPSGRGDWANKVAEYFASTPHLLNLSLGTKQIEGRTVVSVRAEAVEDISDNLIITLYITESDIEGKQNDNGTLLEGAGYLARPRNIGRYSAVLDGGFLGRR